MSVWLLTREQWIEEWLREHVNASYEDAVFEFEDFAEECRAQAVMEGSL